MVFFAQTSTFTRILKLETSFYLLHFGFTNTKYLFQFMEAGKILAFTHNMTKPGVKMAKYNIFSLKTQIVRSNWVLNGLKIGFVLSKLFLVQSLKAGRSLECFVIVLLAKTGGKISKNSRFFVKKVQNFRFKLAKKSVEEIASMLTKIVLSKA